MQMCTQVCQPYAAVVSVWFSRGGGGGRRRNVAPCMYAIRNVCHWQQLGEEGAVQVFKPVNSGDLVLGAVGVLQFEVVASRLLNEYGVDAVFEGTSISSARWVSCEDKRMLADFEKSSAGHNIAYDAAGNMAYLATSGVNLKLTQERWPKLTFHSTREHAIKLA